MDHNQLQIQRVYRGRISDWLNMRRQLPMELWKLCDLCIRFEKTKNTIGQLGNNVAPADVDLLFSGIVQVIGECKSLVQRDLKADEKQKTDKLALLMQDITQTLSLWITEKGLLKDTIEQKNRMFKEGTLPDYARQTVNHAGIIVSRVYDSLQTAIEKQTVRINFVTEFLNRAGITVQFPTSEQITTTEAKK